MLSGGEAELRAVSADSDTGTNERISRGSAMKKLSKSTVPGIRQHRVVPSESTTGAFWVEVKYPAMYPRWEPVSSWASLDGATAAKQFYEKAFHEAQR